MIIGITEAGDASRDFSWVDKIEYTNGSILITKNVTDEFIKAVLPFKNKVIIHATCTGLGGTILEPYVQSVKEQFNQVKKLIAAGFPVEKIVIRIDPIIPTTEGVLVAHEVIKLFQENVKRFRVSIIDMYPHVRKRFEDKKIECPYGDSFSALNEHFKAVDLMLKTAIEEFNDITFECCAEPRLKVPEQCGCISKKDFELLNLNFVTNSLVGIQRKDCLCPSCKTELLENKKRCPNKCVYCYWR